MIGLLEGFGQMLKTASLDSGSWGYAVIVMAVIIKFATFIMTQHEIKTLQMTPMLQSEFDAISKRHAKNKDEKMKQIILLGKKTGYKMFAGISNVITQVIIMAVLSATFFYPDLFLNVAGRELSLQFFWIHDISIAPFQILLQGGDSALMLFLYSMILPILSIILYHFLSRYIAAHSLIDKSGQQKALKIGMLAVALMTPQAVSVYLAALVIATVLQYAVTLKFFPLPANYFEGMKE